MKRAWWMAASAVALLACGGNVVVDLPRGSGGTTTMGAGGNGGSGVTTGLGTAGSVGTGIGNGGGTTIGAGGGSMIGAGGGVPGMCTTSLCGMLCAQALMSPEPPCPSVTTAFGMYEALVSCASAHCSTTCAGFIAQCAGAEQEDSPCMGCLMSSCPSQLMACTAN